jgi:opacity protein-like surface antigen
MKKILLLFLLLPFQLTHAQNQACTLEIGISAGTSLSSLVKAKSPFSTMHPRADIQAGLMKGISARYNFTEHLAVNTALTYEAKGTKVEEKTHTENVQMRNEQIFIREISNNYLTFPLLLSWQSSGRFGLYGQAGGYASLLIRSKIYGMDSNRLLIKGNSFPGNLPTLPGENIEKSEFSIDGKSRTHTVDYGYAVGGGVYYAISDKVKLSLNALLNIGLRKIDSQYNNDLLRLPGPNGFVEYRNDYFQLNSRARNINLLLNMGLSFRVK